MKYLVLFAVLCSMMSAEAYERRQKGFRQVYKKYDRPDFKPTYSGYTANGYDGDMPEVLPPAVEEYAPEYEEQYTQEDHDYKAPDTIHQRPSQAEMKKMRDMIYKMTNGECDVGQNPHSWGCTHWTFNNNPVFPLMPMDWWGALQGEWIALTFVNSWQGNRGDEFAMATCPSNNRQAAGIVNLQEGSLMGSMWIENDWMRFANWRGQEIVTSRDSFRELADGYSVVTEMYTGNYSHRFLCRDFNRNNKHHLLCAWEVQFPDQYGNMEWKNLGYMGWLTRADWEDFAPNCQ